MQLERAYICSLVWFSWYCCGHLRHMLFHHLNSIHLVRMKLSQTYIQACFMLTLSLAPHSKTKLQYSVVNLVFVHFGTTRSVLLICLPRRRRRHRCTHTHYIKYSRSFPINFHACFIHSTNIYQRAEHTNFSINEKLFYGRAALWSVGLNFRCDSGSGSSKSFSAPFAPLDM